MRNGENPDSRFLVRGFGLIKRSALMILTIGDEDEVFVLLFLIVKTFIEGLAD